VADSVEKGAGLALIAQAAMPVQIGAETLAATDG
jgi:hypothetical protein